MEPSQSTLPLTKEQINSVPLLLGGIKQRGIRDVIDAHVTPHEAWQGARVGTLVSRWLCHVLAERALPGDSARLGDRAPPDLQSEGMMDEWEREQSWTHSVTRKTYPWTARVLVMRSSAYQAGLRRRWRLPQHAVRAPDLIRWHAVPAIWLVGDEQWQGPFGIQRDFNSSDAPAR